MCEEGGLREGAQAQQAGGRQVYESKYMGRDEIDSILRIQWRSLHNGPPYQEDYYFQVRAPPAPVPLQRPNRCGGPLRAHSWPPTCSTAGPRSALPAAAVLQHSRRLTPLARRRSAARGSGHRGGVRLRGDLRLRPSLCFGDCGASTRHALHARRGDSCLRRCCRTLSL